jgi:hypothetical protein
MGREEEGGRRLDSDFENLIKMSLRFWAARQRRPTENFKYLWLGLIGKTPYGAQVVPGESLPLI